jgi:hypothetical protein
MTVSLKLIVCVDQINMEGEKTGTHRDLPHSILAATTELLIMLKIIPVK